MIRFLAEFEHGPGPIDQHNLHAGHIVMLTSVMFGNNKLLFSNDKSLRRDAWNVVLKGVVHGYWKATNKIINKAGKVYELQGQAYSSLVV